MTDAIAIVAIEEHGMIRISEKTTSAELQSKYTAPNKNKLSGG